MRMSLLDYTQSILSSLGSDEVNSISDTAESLQVADIVKTTYFNIITRAGIPEHKQLIQLNPSLDPGIPVIMYVPDGIKSLEWLKYFNNNNLPTATDPEPGYEYVTILPVAQFLNMTNFNPNATDVNSFVFTDAQNGFPGTYTFYYKNSKQPQYCTILSNYYVIFDGYDSAVDDTLQASKTMGYGSVTPAWRNVDDFVPNIGEEQIPLLLSEAKALAFFELKQQVHNKAEQESRRQWNSLQKNKNLINRPSDFDALPDFGRVGSGYGGPISYFKSRGWDRP